MAETPDRESQADKLPETLRQVSPSRVTVTVVSLAALAILGAATANVLPSFDLPLPNFDRVTFPQLDRIALPKLDHLAWPSFNRASAPDAIRVAAPPPPQTVSVPIPDPIVRAMLRDIQSSQEQDAAALASLTQSSEAQQADLRRISRQLHALTAQVNALHGAVGPLTTSSIPQSSARMRLVRKSRKPTPSLPRPVGPVSVGGAPLDPAAGSGV